ncbi:MAG: hypothetical protein HFF13_08160 [Angelakisella sp.]|nr:hypothetical protein [Angelakisella sp.]
MPGKKAYRIVKGAFVYLYLDLAFFTLSVVLVVRFWEQSLAWFFLAFWAANFAAALWAKRKLILDLLEGRTETFQGQIDHRENAGSLRCVRVEYLVEQGERPRRFILFPDALPLSLDAALGLLSGRTTLRYLPRSLAVAWGICTGSGNWSPPAFFWPLPGQPPCSNCCSRKIDQDKRREKNHEPNF